MRLAHLAGRRCNHPAARRLPAFRQLNHPRAGFARIAPMPPPVPPPLNETELTITDGGRSMAVERFEPERAGPAPAVVLLHGADGLAYRGPAYRAMDFLGWMDAGTETLAAAGPGPTGLMGVSLGGYLALAVAGRDGRAGAVV